MATPTDAATARHEQEVRERSMQTAFPAKVLAYNSDTGTVKLEPQFIETWRDGFERVTEDAESEYIDLVPIAFPRSGDYFMTWPIAAGDFGLVVCTKYSLGVWRDQGQRSDPGDLRRFCMDGAVFQPVNLTPDESPVNKHSGGSYFEISKGGSIDFVALAAKVKDDLDDIKDMLDDIKAVHNAHGHVISPGCFGTNPATSAAVTIATGADDKLVTKSYTVTDPKSSSLKVQ